jgi:hypothetical protein
MDSGIFDIAVEHEGQIYNGWVNPSDKKGENGRPVSFHVVLMDTSFGFLSYNNGKWSSSEERPAELVVKVGEEIEKHFSLIGGDKK